MLKNEPNQWWHFFSITRKKILWQQQLWWYVKKTVQHICRVKVSVTSSIKHIYSSVFTILMLCTLTHPFGGSYNTCPSVHCHVLEHWSNFGWMSFLMPPLLTQAFNRHQTKFFVLTSEPRRQLRCYFTNTGNNQLTVIATQSVFAADPLFSFCKWKLLSKQVFLLFLSWCLCIKAITNM